MKFLYTLSLILEDIKNPKLIKNAVINAILWTLIWVGVGYFLWNPLMNINTTLIELLPFTFIQKSGAIFIAFILWIETILITLGVVASLFTQILKNKIVIFIISGIITLFWTTLFFLNYSSIINYITDLIKLFPFESIEEILSAVLNIFILYSMFIISMFFTSLIFVVKELQESTLNYIELIKTFLKIFFEFGMIFIIAYPLLFIPFLNIFIIAVVWFFLVKTILKHLTAYLEIETEKKEINLLSFIVSILNFVPIINILSPIAALTFLIRYSYEK